MAADDQMGWREQFSLSREIKANLRVLPTRELNSETPAELLDQRITPIDLLFVRNTGRMPAFSATEIRNWTLTIDGEVERPQRWTIDELKAIGSRNVVAVLECAGNGRAYFPSNRLINILDAKAMALDGVISRIPLAKPYQFARSFRPRWKKWPWFAGTVMWAEGAVGCIEWTGVPLAALMRAEGFRRLYRSPQRRPCTRRHRPGVVARPAHRQSPAPRHAGGVGHERRGHSSYSWRAAAAGRAGLSGFGLAEVDRPHRDSRPGA
jgi:Oxidoreductase molybdopterin binding domain